MSPDRMVDRVDALLPQTQCARCGYSACRPYAAAIAAGTADINRCPPGGEATLSALSALTGRPKRPLDPDCGPTEPQQVAQIDEAACIGCTLCIDACPIDAIIGAQKRMHAVLASLCSGCGLCAPPCPVDCIAFVPTSRAWTRTDADAARERYQARSARLARGERIVRRGATAVTPAQDAMRAVRKAAVEAALARARARRARFAR